MNGEAYSSRESGRHGSSRGEYSSRSGRDDRRERGGDRDGARRRSRSPGHRSSRTHDYEVDTYSSSRGDREREREDRYRDRRGDGRQERDWTRDRGPRRDDGDRPPRRERADRDLFDDRRGGGRGGRNDARDEMAIQQGGRDRKRSASPPPKQKEPTPDLTDIVPVTERKRRLTQWDIKPPGYENVTAEQAKLSGMFPLPGAPRQQPMDPSRLKAFMDQPAGGASDAALKPANARQSRRLFVHNLPAGATDASVQDFFNLQLNGINLITGVDPCISAQVSPAGNFALLEFKSTEDATVALALDGTTMEGDAMDTGNGKTAGLEITRPKDYIAPATSEEMPEPGTISSVVHDSPNKLSIANIPVYLTDDQITELLASFGEIKAFVLGKDTGTEESRGIAFCEFTDPSVTAIALEGLEGMELGDQHLKVKRASIGLVQASGLEMGVNAMSMLAGTTSTDLEQGRVLQLLNMVTPEELMDTEEYKDIYEDVQEECGKFGQVLAMEIPRPSGGSRQSPGVGKIFVKFDTNASAKKAMEALAGRKFADRTVVVTFFGEEYFDVRAW